MDHTVCVTIGSSRVSPVVDVVVVVEGARHTSDDARTGTRPTYLRTYLRAYLRNASHRTASYIIHHDAAGPAPPERGLGGVLPRIRV